MCDVCTGELATEDLTDIATGIATDKVLERGHNLLPTFGAGRERDRASWLSLARELEEAGHLIRGDGGQKAARYGDMELHIVRSFESGKDCPQV